MDQHAEEMGGRQDQVGKRKDMPSLGPVCCRSRPVLSTVQGGKSTLLAFVLPGRFCREPSQSFPLQTVLPKYPS